MEMLNLIGNVDITAVADAGTGGDNPATVQILAYTGGVVTVGGWGPVLIDLSSLKTSGDVTLLADHDATISGIVGTAKTQTKNGQLFAYGSISRATEAGRTIINLSRDGVRLQASIGVSVDRQLSTRAKAGDSIPANGKMIKVPDGGVTYVKGGELKEITITAIGADGQTTVDIKAKGEVMLEQADDSVQTLRASATQEAERIAAIYKAGASHPDIMAQGIRDGWDKNRVELEVLRAERPKMPFIPNAQSAGTSEHIEAALMLRAGYDDIAVKTYGPQVTEQAGRMRTKSLVDFCAMALNARGIDTPTSQREMIKASFSSLSLPTVLGNAMNKVLEQTYQMQAATWRSFASVKPASNFKTQKSIKPSWVSGIDQVARDGQLTHGELTEAVYEWSIDTYGKMFSITRQDIINDDIGFFDEIGPLMAKGAARKLSDLVWQTILSNGGSHFHADNDNLLSGGSSVLSLTSLATAIKQMRKQRDSEGHDIDMVPRVLVVPPDLEETAKNILNSQEIRDTTADLKYATGNSLQAAVKLEVESRISNTDNFSGASATQWYLFAGPQDNPVTVGFLDGVETPTVEFFGLDHNVNQLGVSFRVYHDFGVALGDFRAGQKSAGA